MKSKNPKTKRVTKHTSQIEQEFTEGRQKQTRLVICITGMPGAGKSTISEVAQDLGFEVFRMGDDVRMETERRKLEPSDENLGAIMLELRQKHGPVAIASLSKERIERESKSRFVLIDGVRNMNEFQEFKKLGSALLIAVHASPQRRYHFLKVRGRSDSPSNWQSFEARDRRELSVGVGETIALADDIVPNDGSLEELKQNSEKLFRAIMERADEK
ncbi:MAG: AAA family ATPase [Nitrososphaerales archaeon]